MSARCMHAPCGGCTRLHGCQGTPGCLWEVLPDACGLRAEPKPKRKKKEEPEEEIHKWCGGLCLSCPNHKWCGGCACLAPIINSCHRLPLFGMARCCVSLLIILCQVGGGGAAGRSKVAQAGASRTGLFPALRAPAQGYLHALRRCVLGWLAVPCSRLRACVPAYEHACLLACVGVTLYAAGKPFALEPAAEEVAGFYSAMLSVRVALQQCWALACLA